MCSNNSGSSSDGVVDGNGGLSPNSKKPQKRQRVPKRGPGVAELEKILREQENKNDHIIEAFNPSCFVPVLPPLFSNNNNDHFHSFPQTLNSISRPPQPPPPPPPPPPIPTIPMTPTMSRRSVNLGHQYVDQIAPVAPNLYATNGNTTSFLQRPNFGVSGVALLDQKAFFPVTWSSTTAASMSNSNADEGKYSNSSSIVSSLPKPFSNESNPLWSSPSLMQNKHPQNPNSMINQFRGSASSSSATSSAGLYHPIEPPSSQRSYHSYPSMGHEEEKACVIGMKRRSQSFPIIDNPPGPIFQHQVPQLLSHMHRPADQLSSYNLDLSKTMPPTRDAKLDSCLELNMHNYTTQYGAPNASFVKFVPQTVVSPPLHTFQDRHVSKFDMLPFQASMEEYSNRRSEPAGSDCNKPFYKFLLSKEQMGSKENIHSVDSESEPGEEGIDLNLKL